jgi:hypothetical protein
MVLGVMQVSASAGKARTGRISSDEVGKERQGRICSFTW